MKKLQLKPIIVLTSICLVVALCLSLVNMITAPIIAGNQSAEANKALLELLPNGKNFEELTIDDTYPSSIKSGYKADGGYVFSAEVAGKNTGLVIMCGIDADGKIVSTKVIATQETVSYAEKVFPLVEGTNGAYTGMGLDSFDPFLVTGATLTSKAYSEAIKATLQAYAIACGGEVDIRTPEQILQDNCNAALGTSDITFERWFATEALIGIDKTYVAADNSGFVFVIGEAFVGVDASGVKTADASTENAAKAMAAYALASATTLTEITDLPTTGINRDIVIKAYQTATGNYVFDLKASGFANYSYEHGYTDEEVPIYISVSISPDGKIIDCVTTEQYESKGYGEACGSDDYYDQWSGASESDIIISTGPIGKDSTDIGAIAGATITTKAYQTAIKAAFGAFEALTGGDQND